MDILIVSATEAELIPFFKEITGVIETPTRAVYKEKMLEFLVTGVGSTATAARLSRILSTKKYDLVINIGIAGAYSKNLTIGDVVFVENDIFGDMGAELADGSFADTTELGLAESSEILTCTSLPQENTLLYHKLCRSAISVQGLTVNTVSGTLPTITARQSKYHPETESMEGAAFYYTCLLHKQLAVQVRAISNYVTPRNREEWNIPLAVRNINDWLSEFIQSL
jgi:futalosine hydrolase